MQIYNCHVHTFTIDHVPDRFIPKPFGWLLQNKTARRLVGGVLRSLIPYSDRDIFDRYVNFMDVTYNSTQKAVFERVMGYYPFNTQFIVLPMDMAYMGAGNVEKSLHVQHRDLAELRETHYPNIIPFVAVDPRRDGLLETVRYWVEERSFRGLKLYPPLGFYPFDERLDPIYAYAEANNLPVMAHCARSGIYDYHPITDDKLTHPLTGAKLPLLKRKDFCDVYADPDNYRPILEKFPNLRICLAHFGGSGEWRKYLDEPWYPADQTADITIEQPKKSWLSKIKDMICVEGYRNLYTDISYTLFTNSQDNFAILKVLLEDTNLAHRVLFGSDYYMIERERSPERRMPFRLRAHLGEEKFRLIAQDNPRAYLGEV